MKTIIPPTVRSLLVAMLAGAALSWCGTAYGQAPEIVVEQPEGTPLAGGATVDFGSSELDVEVELTFGLLNTGDAPLTGVVVTIDGAHASDFAVSWAPDEEVGAEWFTYFKVKFTPSATGARTATLHVASNDADENPFNVTLNGNGVLAPGAEIKVEQPEGVDVRDGNGRVGFGLSPVNAGVPLIFTIKNRGASTLTGVAATIDGDNATNFVITTPPADTVLSGQSTTMQVVFTPDAVDTRRADLHIASNDTDENPFDIRLNGSGLDPNTEAIWLELTLPEGGEDSLWTRGAVLTAQGDIVVARSGGFYDENTGDWVPRLYLEKRSGANGDVIDTEIIPDFEFRSMISSPDGNFLLAGQTHTMEAEVDLLTVHKRSSATLGSVWRFDRDGPDVTSGNSDDDLAEGLAVDVDGNVIVVGRSEELDGRQGIVLKIEGTGGTQIGSPYLSGIYAAFDAVATSASGGVFVAGHRTDYSSYPYASYLTMTRLNAALTTVVWPHETTSDNAYYYKVITDALGNVIACGYIEDETTGSNRLMVRKWDGATGGLLWERIRNVGQSVEYDSEGFDVEVDGNGDVVVAGYSWVVETINLPDHGEFYTAKLAGGTGVVVWEKFYNDPVFADGRSFANQLVIEPVSNHVMVCGELNSGFALLRYASLDGTLLNEVLQQLPGGGDWPALMQGADGALFVATGSEDAGEDSFGVTAKFAAFSSQGPLQTLSATNVTATTARLNGVLTPGAVEFNMVFEWSLDPITAPRFPEDPFNNTSTATPPVIYASNPATPFFVDLTGLQPHTTYYFRARANYLPAALWGQERSFTTVNRNPVAAPDSITVSYESWMTVSPLINDSEPDNDPITMTSFNQPWYGSVVRSGNSFTYTAPPGFVGIDVFTYTIEDGFGGSTEGTVTVNVQQTYTRWLESHNLTGLDALPDADPNGDGIKNVQSFLHGIPPGEMPAYELLGRLPVPGMLNPVGGPPCFTYTYYRSAAAGLNVAYEASETLQGAWTPIIPTNTTVLWSDEYSGDRIVRVEFCLTNGEARMFIRMVLSAP